MVNYIRSRRLDLPIIHALAMGWALMRYENLQIKIVAIGHPDNFHAGIRNLDGLDQDETDVLYDDMVMKWEKRPRQEPYASMKYMDFYRKLRRSGASRTISKLRSGIAQSVPLARIVRSQLLGYMHPR